jgi:hypothetical protein
MNKKPAARNSRLNMGLDKLTIQSITQTSRTFAYKCSFCWRELPNGGLRFAGFGVCPPHLKLAETIVDLLRGHAANYSNRFGGVK